MALSSSGGAPSPPPPSPATPSQPAAETKPQNPSPISPSPFVNRLWRPAAQRNLRNQWSKLFSYKDQWASASAGGRGHATSLVNAYLSQRYMSGMELGVLSQMSGIRSKACGKLSRQQELHGRNLMSSYKDLVSVVTHMQIACASMRCYMKGSSDSPLVQFCSQPDDCNDAGDGGGMRVFSLLSIPCFEKWAYDLVQMFGLELSMKRLIVVEMLSLSCEASERQRVKLMCHKELYPGELNELKTCNLHVKEISESLPPAISEFKFGTRSISLPNCLPDREILQVYLTAWLAEVNVDMKWVDQVFDMIGEDIGSNFFDITSKMGHDR